MTTTRRPDPNRDRGGLPLWLNITGCLTFLSLLVFNVIVYGDKGYPTTVVLGGLLGAQFGLDKLLRGKGGE